MHVGSVSGGDIAKGWKWDGSNLVVKGDVYITNGDIAGTPASYVHGWQYGSTTYIDGGNIYAGTVTAPKVTVTGFNLLPNPGFENGFQDWTLTSTAVYLHPNTKKAGAYSAFGEGNGTTRSHLHSYPMPVIGGEVYHIWFWGFTYNTSGTVQVWYDWLGNDKTTIVGYNGFGGAPGGTWTKYEVTVTAPSNAGYLYLDLVTAPDIAAGGYAHWDELGVRQVTDVQLLVGTPGSSRVEINSNGIEGYDTSNTKQFYLSTSDGKAYCAGGSVAFDQNRISISVPSSLSSGYFDFVTGSTTIGTLRMSTGGSPVNNVMYLASTNYGSGQVASTIIRALQDTSNFNELRVDWNSSTSHAYWSFQGTQSGTVKVWAQIDVPFSGTPALSLQQGMNLNVAGSINVGGNVYSSVYTNTTLYPGATWTICQLPVFGSWLLRVASADVYWNLWVGVIQVYGVINGVSVISNITGSNNPGLVTIDSNRYLYYKNNSSVGTLYNITATLLNL